MLGDEAPRGLEPPADVHGASEHDRVVAVDAAHVLDIGQLGRDPVLTEAAGDRSGDLPRRAVTARDRDEGGHRRAKRGRNIATASAANASASAVMKTVAPPDAVGSSFAYIAIAIPATAGPTRANHPATR